LNAGVEHTISVLCKGFNESKEDQLFVKHRRTVWFAVIIIQGRLNSTWHQALKIGLHLRTPFTSISLDFAGSLYLRVSGKKAYICLIIHLHSYSCSALCVGQQNGNGTVPTWSQTDDCTKGNVRHYLVRQC